MNTVMCPSLSPFEVSTVRYSRQAKARLPEFLGSSKKGLHMVKSRKRKVSSADVQAAVDALSEELRAGQLRSKPQNVR